VDDRRVRGIGRKCGPLEAVEKWTEVTGVSGCATKIVSGILVGAGG